MAQAWQSKGQGEMCDFIKRLDRRREALGMTVQQLAKRTGISLPTLHRILSGRSRSVNFANVLAIADALEMKFDVAPRADLLEVRKNQALKKAKQLCAMIQGSVSLEAEGMGAGERSDIENEMADELLSGRRRALFA